jgi:predicted ArsR family transcriptional regulator
VVLTTAGVLFLAQLSWEAALRTYAYGDPVRMYAYELKNNSNSSRAHINYAVALHDATIEKLSGDETLRATIRHHFSRAAELDPEVAYPALAQLAMACHFGDDIDPEWERRLFSHWIGLRPYGERMHVMSLFANEAIGQRLCLDPATARRHFEAFVANPLTSAEYRAIIRIRHGEFEYRVIGDLERAMELFELAKKTSDSASVMRMYASVTGQIKEEISKSGSIKSLSVITGGH